MGFLNLSPEKVKVVRDVVAIATVGYFFVVGISYTFLSLQHVLAGVMP